MEFAIAERGGQHHFAYPFLRPSNVFSDAMQEVRRTPPTIPACQAVDTPRRTRTLDPSIDPPTVCTFSAGSRTSSREARSAPLRPSDGKRVNEPRPCALPCQDNPHHHHHHHHHSDYSSAGSRSSPPARRRRRPSAGGIGRRRARPRTGMGWPVGPGARRRPWPRRARRRRRGCWCVYTYIHPSTQCARGMLL